MKLHHTVLSLALVASLAHAQEDLQVIEFDGVQIRNPQMAPALSIVAQVYQALVLQVIVLPAACYAIIMLLNVPPLFAVEIGRASCRERV